MKTKHHDEPLFEYNQITDQIFIGTNFCCQIHFDEDLLSKDITVDVSLEGEKVDAPYGVEFFSWIPVKDEHAPTMDQFGIGVSVLDKLIKMGKKVYVHCEHGHGRAPTLVAAYFISQGTTTESAAARIKEKRPVIHLNNVQITALKKFEKITLDKKN